MKKLGELSLGIVTGVGGYLDISSLVTAAQAGATFGYRLLWAAIAGGICAAFLCEQAGRLAAVGGRTVSDAIRERFGSTYHLLLFAVVLAVSLLILPIEIGGTCVALQFATGIGFQWWAVPVAFACWLILWRGSFAFVEYGVSSVSLVTLCFVAAAWWMHPEWSDVLRGLLPSRPDHDPTRYWFLAAIIIGASIAPYLFLFYSSGAIEDRWTSDHVGVNRAIAAIGMGFGALISGAALVVAADAFGPRGIGLDHYTQLGLLLLDAMGPWGFWLLVVSLAVACLGTAVEIALVAAYMAAQGFGWPGSQDAKPRDQSRFALVYTGAIVAGTIPVLIGWDPIQVTTVSLALTALTLPVAVGPLLFVMNDPTYLGEHVNGRLSNVVVVAIIALAFVLAVVTVPLQIFGS